MVKGFFFVKYLLLSHLLILTFVFFYESEDCRTKKRHVEFNWLNEDFYSPFQKPQAANTTTAKGKKPTKAALEASLVDLAKEKDETEDKLVAKEVLLQQTLLKLKQATEAHNKEVDTLRLEADQEKVRRQEVAWTLQAMELAKKEFQALVAEFKQRKAGFEVEKKSQGSKLGKFGSRCLCAGLSQIRSIWGIYFLFNLLF